MILVQWYREWQGRRQARRRLGELMEELAHLAAERRRAAGAWRSPTLRAPIGIHPMPDHVPSTRRARSPATMRARGSFS